MSDLFWRQCSLALLALNERDAAEAGRMVSMAEGLLDADLPAAGLFEARKTHLALLRRRADEIAASGPPPRHRERPVGKFSIITPSFNAAGTIEQAIQSVLAQDYEDYEHIVVDGSSTDGTLDILKRYPHLVWVSERDRGQVHAINKGITMASGDIIGCLNADDSYLKGAFSAVIPYFRAGERMVVGRVVVRSEKPDGVSEWICDAKVLFGDVVRHWEGNAFCVNPAGYFCLSKLYESVPLREEMGAKHDLDFLMRAALRFPIRKIDRDLGIFNHLLETQTGREQSSPSYWRPENFPFVDELVGQLPEREQRQYRLDQERGYQLRRKWTIREAIAGGRKRQLLDDGEAVPFPDDRIGSGSKSPNQATDDQLVAKRDWVTLVITSGFGASGPVCPTLRALQEKLLPGMLYEISPVIDEGGPGSKAPQGLAAEFRELSRRITALFHEYRDDFRWKLIVGVRDPIEDAVRAASIGGVFADMEPEMRMEENLKHANINLDGALREVFGVNILGSIFPRGKNYSIVSGGNVDMLVFRVEDFRKVFPVAIEEFLGISRAAVLGALAKNATGRLDSGEHEAEGLRFDRQFLESVYATTPVKHFYSADEIDRFLKARCA